MPLCVSCRGEYPLSGKKSIHQPQADGSEEPYKCPRCGTDNQKWDKWLGKDSFAHLGQFFLNSWGLLLLGLLLLPIGLFLFNIPLLTTSIGIVLAVFLILVFMMLLYVLKESLWRYDLLARVGRGLRPTLIGLAVISLLLAIVCGAGSMSSLAQARTSMSASVQRENFTILFVSPTFTPTSTPTNTPTPTPTPTFTPTSTPTSTPTFTPTPCCQPYFYSCW